MQDEILLRQWTAGHSQFSADLDRGIGKIRAWATGHPRSSQAIGSTYAATDRSPDRVAASAGATLLSGLAAVATTVTLFASVAILATPSSAHDSSLQPSTSITVGYELA